LEFTRYVINDKEQQTAVTRNAKGMGIVCELPVRVLF